jgi:hypothetical protein
MCNSSVAVLPSYGNIDGNGNSNVLPLLPCVADVWQRLESALFLALRVFVAVVAVVLLVEEIYRVYRVKNIYKIYKRHVGRVYRVRGRARCARMRENLLVRHA